MIDDVVPVFLGWFLGLFTPLVYVPIRRLWVRLRVLRDDGDSSEALDSLKFFTLNSWSPKRQLERSKVEVFHSSDDWQQTWIPHELLNKEKISIADPGGPSSTLRSIVVDHRESDQGQRLLLKYAKSEYSDFIAVSRILTGDPALAEAITHRLRSEDSSTMVEQAPPSVTAINVTVFSEDRLLLILRRSAAVRTSQNEWTLGPNETMLGPRLQAQAGGMEDPFQLAERCLMEETGVGLDELRLLCVSWVGYNVPGAICHWLAHAKVRLTSRELTRRISQSHGGFEVDAIDWMKFDSKALDGIRQSAEAGSLDAHGRLWNRTAGLAAHDIRRWRLLLSRD